MWKATGGYRTYSIAALVKLQPWFLSLRWKTCPWAEHSDDITLHYINYIIYIYLIGISGFLIF